MRHIIEAPIGGKNTESKQVGWVLLAPNDFPMVVVGDHWVTISNQYSNYILDYTVK